MLFNRQCCGAECQQLDTFKGHLTPEINNLHSTTNKDLVVIPGNKAGQHVAPEEHTCSPLSPA
jgi:hypothetical protein